jgi:hypothetical protein
MKNPKFWYPTVTTREPRKGTVAEEGLSYKDRCETNVTVGRSTPLLNFHALSTSTLNIYIYICSYVPRELCLPNYKRVRIQEFQADQDSPSWNSQRYLDSGLQVLVSEKEGRF